MIQSAVFRNFKSLRDVRVELERFTVLAGPNGSGKSSVLQGLDLLCRASEGVSALSASRTFGSEGPIELACVSDGEPFRLTESQPPAERTGPLLRSTYLRLGHPLLEGDSQARLAGAACSRPDEWTRVTSDFRHLFPFVTEVRFVAEDSSQALRLQFDTRTAGTLGAEQLSEGTRFALAALSAVHLAGGPSLILVGDLGFGLHPVAQGRLVAQLDVALNARPDVQLVATTYSPDLLYHVRPEGVRVTFLRDNGTTAVAPLSRHPRFEKWREEFTAGEFWSVFGEEWVVKPELASWPLNSAAGG